MIPNIASDLRGSLPKWEIFDDWYAAGPEADDYWKTYEESRGRTYEQALSGYAAKHVFEFDKHHLDTASAGILVLPAGRSGHLELGYLAGRGAYTGILLDAEYDRWDVMYAFASRVTRDIGSIVDDLKEVH